MGDGGIYNDLWHTLNRLEPGTTLDTTSMAAGHPLETTHILVPLVWWHSAHHTINIHCYPSKDLAAARRQVHPAAYPAFVRAVCLRLMEDRDIGSWMLQEHGSSSRKTKRDKRTLTFYLSDLKGPCFIWPTPKVYLPFASTRMLRMDGRERGAALRKQRFWHEKTGTMSMARIETKGRIWLTEIPSQQSATYTGV